jgi:hypothetical protein
MTVELLSVKKKNDRNFITVECLLAFDKNEDKEKVLNLMRRWKKKRGIDFKFFWDECADVKERSP